MQHDMLKETLAGCKATDATRLLRGHCKDQYLLSASSSSSSSDLMRPVRISYIEYDRGQECTTRACSDIPEPNENYCYRFHLKKLDTVLIVCCFLTVIAYSIIPVTAGIDCFKCVSLNGDNPSCEDPFHNNYSVSILESPCMGGRKGRNGLFPATACIKLAGVYYDTGETITVRGCALDSGTLNVDTEIIRMSHCGHFWFNERYVKGCLQSCDDADGCNGSTRPNHIVGIMTPLLIIWSILSIFNFTPNLGFYYNLGVRFL